MTLNIESTADVRDLNLLCVWGHSLFTGDYTPTISLRVRYDPRVRAAKKVVYVGLIVVAVNKTRNLSKCVLN